MLARLPGRSLQMIPTFVLIGVVVFVLIRLLPGDPAAALLGVHATPEALARINAQLGFNRPIWVQFVLFVERLLHGDLGISVSQRIPVTEVIAQRLPVTLCLVILAALIALMLLPLAFVAALRQNRATDIALRGIFQVGLSTPTPTLSDGPADAVRLADEPTTALDVTIQDQILKLLLRLRESLGMAVILVTHDLGVVAQSCDRVAVLYAGRVAEYGEVGVVFAAPRHAYTLGLLRSVPDAKHTRQPLRPIGGAPPPPDMVGERCPFMPRCIYSTASCAAGRPPLIAMPEGGLSACIHWDRLEPTVWAA